MENSIPNKITEDLNGNSWHAVEADEEVYALLDQRRAELFDREAGFHVERSPEALRQQLLEEGGNLEVLHLDLLQALTIAAENNRDFQDQRETVELWLVPARPTPTVAPVRLHADITRLAPFRRLVLYLSIAVCSLGTIILLVRLVMKLREPVE